MTLSKYLSVGNILYSMFSYDGAVFSLGQDVEGDGVSNVKIRNADRRLNLRGVADTSNFHETILPRKIQSRKVQLCAPLPNGEWDCGSGKEYDNEDLDSISSPTDLLIPVSNSPGPPTYSNENVSPTTLVVPFTDAPVPPKLWTTDPPTTGPTSNPTNRPTNFPTHRPTDGPTGRPTGRPTNGPTGGPTNRPTEGPSKRPTGEPTNRPTGGPSKRPTGEPTRRATKLPTGPPTDSPTTRPTKLPTRAPTRIPTRYPTEAPTKIPTKSPIVRPTSPPTSKPTKGPTKTQRTGEPTSNPTTSPVTSPKPKALCGFQYSLVNDRALLQSTCRDTISTVDDDRALFYGNAICSPNLKYMFGFTTDGFLALCEVSNTGKWMEMVWKTGPFHGDSQDDPLVKLQKTGNLVVRNKRDKWASDHRILWETGVISSFRAELKIQNDGNVAIIDSKGTILWDDPQGIPTPTATPTITVSPSLSRSPISSTTYHPGEMWYDATLGIYLSTGLKGRVLAHSKKRVVYDDGSESEIKFHINPDAGACFDATDGSGGWYYMSNSEVKNEDDDDGVGKGGVGRIGFDRNGNILDYRMMLENTHMNCGAGSTPWNTFISCEEFKYGQCWEVHPQGKWPARVTKMGGEEGDRFESAAFDDRDFLSLKGFITTDSKKGAVRRYSPTRDVLEAALREGDFSDVLHSEGGTLEFLVLSPETNTFRWTADKEEGEESARLFFSNTEGVDAHDGLLYIVSKKIRSLFVLDLDHGTYTNSSTVSGPFAGQPDQIVRLIPELNSFDGENSKLQNEDGLLYFLEDGGGGPAGVFAWDKTGKRFFTIAEGGADKSNETTGLAFCDRGRRMIFAFQDEGVVFELSREDGQSFHGSHVDVHYHDMSHWPELEMVSEEL